MKTSKRINGVLLLDKATGISSNGALQQVKRLFNAQKAGHTGSLDPLASGILPICFGEATKFARFLLDADKTYLVTAKLGIVTDSGDAEGSIIAKNAVPNFTQEYIKQQIAAFIGVGKQIPSMYSALKHKGKPLYKLARQNISIVRAARDILVHAFELLDLNGDLITCRIKCSKGTYIRTLIEDLGITLGCGAHVIALRREQAGPFTIEQAIQYADLEVQSNLQSFLLPPDALLAGLPKIVLSASQACAISNGRTINMIPQHVGIICLVTEANALLGIAEAHNDGNIVAVRLVATQEVMV